MIESVIRLPQAFRSPRPGRAREAVRQPLDIAVGKPLLVRPAVEHLKCPDVGLVLFKEMPKRGHERPSTLSRLGGVSRLEKNVFTRFVDCLLVGPPYVKNQLAQLAVGGKRL